ncbi:hypothetical protein [Pseudomonas sp. TE24901]
MKIFYSAKANAFFNELFHGTRTIQIPDPEWVRPTRKVLDPAWELPTTEVPNPEWSEDSLAPEFILIPDMDAEAPLIDVPDDQAKWPEISAPNPACLLPPEDEVVEVSQADHDAIFRAVASGGSTFTAGENGRPIIIDAPGPTLEELKSRERAVRDRVLLLTDPLIARHRDELEAERPTTLTAEQYKQLQGYRQDLRDWPESEHFPAIEYRPEQPAWLAEHLQ